MAPTSLHTLLPRDNPSLGQLFEHFPAKVWLLLKFIIFGTAILLALYAIILGAVSAYFGIRLSFAWIVINAPKFIDWLRSGEWREVGVGWREKVGRLEKIEMVGRMLKLMKSWSTRRNAEAVDAEELEHLDGSHESDGREGSVSGETLFEGDEDGGGDGQARKKEDIVSDSEVCKEGKA